MAWRENHRTGQRYYYRNRRNENGRVVTQYLGRGEEAQAAAQAVKARLANRRAHQLALDDLQAALRQADTAMARLCSAVTVIMEATLLALGYHRTNYGPWRRKRNEKRDDQKTND